ncbi:MAG: DUF2953 domain-containing protein [Methanosarcinaceae archaeon]|nr:DUF2953 domain-containing protein [Methanosarcinaceae archaeon]
MFLESVIALLIVLLLLLLFVSFRISLELDKQGEKFQYRIRIKWLFLSYSLRPGMLTGKEKAPQEAASSGSGPAEKPALGKELKEAASDAGVPPEGRPPAGGKKKDVEKKEKEEPERWTLRNVLVLLRLMAIPIIRFLEGILKAIDIHRLRISLKFGFDDPADTGMLAGYLYALRSYLECRYERVRLYAEPNFVEMMLDFNVTGDIRFRIAGLVPPVLKIIFNRDVLRVFWAIIRKKDIPVPA